MTKEKGAGVRVATVVCRQCELVMYRGVGANETKNFRCVGCGIAVQVVYLPLEIKVSEVPFPPRIPGGL